MKKITFKHFLTEDDKKLRRRLEKLRIQIEKGMMIDVHDTREIRTRGKYTTGEIEKLGYIEEYRNKTGHTTVEIGWYVKKPVKFKIMYGSEERVYDLKPGDETDGFEADYS